MSDDVSTEQEYILGTHAAELHRLGFQHHVWAAPTAAAWDRAGFGPGMRLLDVGCGPGHGTFDLAALVGATGHVLGVDASQRYVAHLNGEAHRRGLAHVEARVEELERLDLPEASLDGAFARWVLCWLRDPGAVIARVARALRPGARFVVLDYSHYEGFALAPRAPASERVIAAVAEAFRRSDGNPDVGRELPGLMRRAGLEVETLRPLVRLARPGSALWAWPWSFFELFLPGLVAAGGLSAEDHAAFAQEWAERSRDPDAFLFTPPMVEVIARKR